LPYSNDISLKGRKSTEITYSFVPPLIQEKYGTVIGNHQRLEQIGEGGRGDVSLARRVEGSRLTVALKVKFPGYSQLSETNAAAISPRISGGQAGKLPSGTLSLLSACKRPERCAAAILFAAALTEGRNHAQTSITPPGSQIAPL
jgi:hypothetical protein